MTAKYTVARNNSQHQDHYFHSLQSLLLFSVCSSLLMRKRSAVSQSHPSLCELDKHHHGRNFMGRQKELPHLSINFPNYLKRLFTIIGILN